LGLPDIANEASGSERQFVNSATARVIAEGIAPPKYKKLVASTYIHVTGMILKDWQIRAENRSQWGCSESFKNSWQ